MIRFFILMMCYFLFLAGCATTASVSNVVSQEAENRIFAPVHFPTGSDRVLSKDIHLLNEDAEWLKDNGWAVVVIEGHCDERGSDSYNIKLGDRRARRVKSYLIGNGMMEEQITGVVSYGKRRPSDPRHNFAAWRHNRRVEIKLR